MIIKLNQVIDHKIRTGTSKAQVADRGPSVSIACAPDLPAICIVCNTRVQLTIENFQSLNQFICGATKTIDILLQPARHADSKFLNAVVVHISYIGLDEQARLIPLRDDESDWEHPVLTSLEAGKLFEHCRDARVSVIVSELEQLRRDNVDLYRLIEEIDFGAEAYLYVTVSGLQYRLKLRAESFVDDLGRFVEFVGSFNPVLDSVTMVDLRFDQMIVCTERKKKNGR